MEGVVKRCQILLMSLVMKTTFPRRLFLFKVAVWALVSVTLAPCPLVLAQPLAARVDALFAEQNKTDAPGASVAVVRDGETILKSAYGLADIEKKIPVSTATAFHLASVGKQMTALAVLMLSNEGKLSIDDPVEKYLPQFRGWGSKVKIRHLLYHTGGIPDYYEDIEDTYAKPTNSQALKFLAQLSYLEFRPGAKFDYSNVGYDTLGALVQKVSGARFGQFMEARVFAPAGMTNSFAFDPARRKVSTRALGYRLERKKYYLDDTNALNGLHGSGSIYASIDDMAKYDAALFGYRYVSKEVLDQAFVSGQTNRGRSVDYGFGWELLNDEDVGEPYYGHSGAWMGFSTYYLHYPARKLSIVVVANCSATDAESLVFATGLAAIRSQ
jgi:CubicO group peptidase (beta-lactamase class C family)